MSNTRIPLTRTLEDMDRLDRLACRSDVRPFFSPTRSLEHAGELLEDVVGSAVYYEIDNGWRGEPHERTVTCKIVGCRYPAEATEATLAIAIVVACLRAQGL